VSIRETVAVPVRQGERCAHPDCQGHQGEHPEKLETRGRILHAEVTWTSEPPSDFLSTNIGLGYPK
jgi:hypothetical protein